MPRDSGCGKSMSNEKMPDWELVLSSAARLQYFVPGAVLVGDTASALFAEHRFSRDADHVLTDLKERFDDILTGLESVAGWKTARVRRPVLILGSLDGIETGVRQLIRDTSLETAVMEIKGQKLTVPTEAEILRIKGVLILKRNATRDYLDFAALADHMGKEKFLASLDAFDDVYPQPNGESALVQLQVQLADPMPFDLDETDLGEYKNLRKPWTDWNYVRDVCVEFALAIFDHL